MTEISRRQVLAGAAATVAAAAVPVSAIAAGAEPSPTWSLMFPDWQPDRYYTPYEMIKIGNRVHVVFQHHLSGDAPSVSFISRPLLTDGDGQFVVSEDGRLVEGRPGSGT